MFHVPFTVSFLLFLLSGSVVLVVCRWAGHVRLPQSCIRKEYTKSATIGNVHTYLHMLLCEKPGVRWPLWAQTLTCAPNSPLKAIITPVIPKSLLTLSYTSTPLHTPSFWILNFFFPAFLLFLHVVYSQKNPSREPGNLSNFLLPAPFSHTTFSVLP